MYDYYEELNRENTRQRKAWNGKVITTSNQWNYNNDGSACVSSSRYGLEDIMSIGREMLRMDRDFERGYAY